MAATTTKGTDAQLGLDITFENESLDVSKSKFVWVAAVSSGPQCSQSVVSLSPLAFQYKLSLPLDALTDPTTLEE